MELNLQMDIVARRFPRVFEALSEADSSSVTVEPSRTGMPVPALSRAGKPLFIHSRFDPLTEARRFADEIDVSQFDLLVVLGFGFAYHLELIRDRLDENAVLLVIERDPAVIRAALAHRDISPLLNDRRVVILSNPGEDEIAEAIKGKSSRRSSFITHRGSFQTDPGWYANMLEVVRSYLSTKDVNIATLAKFEKVWSANLARNIRTFIKAPGAACFYGQFAGVPAIVAGAGPSLDRSIGFIRENRDRAVIIAVDTSYRILVKHGIVPHFCLCVDPQAINARYFEGSLPDRTMLVADPTVHPSVFRLFPGRVTVTSVAFQLMKWIEDAVGDKGEMTHGGSVSTNAYDFARRIGAGPVILVGQDLAFTGGLAHARGSYLDEQVHLRTGRMFTPEMQNRFQLTALPAIRVRGIASPTVHTNQKMMIFLQWFENRRDASLINATPDGASIPGVAHRSSDEIELPPANLDIDERIDRCFAGAPGGEPAAGPRLTARVDRVAGEIESLIVPLSRAVGFSESLMKILGDRKADRGKMDYLLGKLAETDRIIESKKNARDIISAVSQRVVHTITEGYDIDESDRHLSEKQMVAKRSRYLYAGLLEAARFNRKILGKMLALLS